MNELQFQKIDPPEVCRTYHFANGKFAISGIVSVCVRPSGTHRLETSDGRKYIVPAGWLAIELEVPNWTF